MQFPSTMPHRYANPTEETTRAVTVILYDCPDDAPKAPPDARTRRPRQAYRGLRPRGRARGLARPAAPPAMDALASPCHVEDLESRLDPVDCLGDVGVCMGC